MKFLIYIPALDRTKKIAFNYRNYRVIKLNGPKSIKNLAFYPSFSYPYAYAKHRGTKIKAQQIGAAWLGEHRGTRIKDCYFEGLIDFDNYFKLYLINLYHF